MRSYSWAREGQFTFPHAAALLLVVRRARIASSLRAPPAPFLLTLCSLATLLLLPRAPAVLPLKQL